MTSNVGANAQNGLESAASKLLIRAVEMDRQEKYLQAVALYVEGVAILMDAMKSWTDADDEKRVKVRAKIEGYLSRAEKLKGCINNQKAAGNFREQIHIALNDTGYSYNTVFSPLLDDLVTSVHVNDPYIRLYHQILNFVRFCEVLVKRSPHLKLISLTTGRDDFQSDGSRKYQDDAFKELTQSLADRSVTLKVNFSTTLHDRDVKFDNGWVVKIGRGLDYFRPTPKFSIGAHDFDLRPCQQTVIDIFHENSLRKG